MSDTTNSTNELEAMRAEAGVSREAIAFYLEVSGKTPYNWEHLPADKVKAHHRFAYAEAIRRATGSAVIAGYLSAA
jgi:DNA-binding XRE family transcriptional regulator